MTSDGNSLSFSANKNEPSANIRRGASPETSSFKPDLPKTSFDSVRLTNCASVRFVFVSDFITFRIPVAEELQFFVLNLNVNAHFLFQFQIRFEKSPRESDNPCLIAEHGRPRVLSFEEIESILASRRGYNTTSRPTAMTCSMTQTKSSRGP